MGAPPSGRLTTRPTGRGGVAAVASMSMRWASRATIRVSSIWASAKPMQLRAPRLKGTQAMSARARRSSGGSTKRSGSKRSGSSHGLRRGRRGGRRRAPTSPSVCDSRRRRRRPLPHRGAATPAGCKRRRLPHDPVGQVEAPERRLVDRRRTRQRAVDHVGFGSQPLPHAGRESAAPEHPRQRRRRGVEARAHQRAHLVADLPRR